jgi:hypothetical protein
MADFDAQLPVRALASEFTTSVSNAAFATINPAEDYGQGSTTSGQNGVLIQGATTTTAPLYTTGTSNPLSLDTSGNLRVTLASSVVNATGTLTNNNAAPIADNLGVLPALANAVHPTWTEGFQVLLSEDLSGNLRVITGTGSTTAVTGNVTVVQPTGTNLHTVVDNFPADADALAQGSTTSGQLGALVMGAVTTVAPTYTTATTNPLSIDTSGNLRVAATLTSPTSILTYFTDALVATSATVTHSVAGPTTLDHIHSAGSGMLKMTVAIGTTGSETDRWVGFTSSAGQDCEFDIENDYVIPAGQSVKVTLKNRDLAAQDLYLTFETH